MKRRDGTLRDVMRELETRGIDPVEGLAKIVSSEFVIHERDLDQPYIQRMLNGDYEAVPVVGQPGRLVVRARLRYRQQIMLALMEYVSPKLRATEISGGLENTPRVIQLVQFGDVKPAKDAPALVVDTAPAQINAP